MQLLLPIVLAANACSFSQAFTPPILISTVHSSSGSSLVAPLHSSARADAERLLAKARALREVVEESEDKLHSTLINKKATKDAATDKIISCLFPTAEDDGMCALCDRLRQKRLASDKLVQVVERLHEREVAAKGLEHVESSVNENEVTFNVVAEPNEAEMEKIQGLVNRLIEAAEVLDKEFIEKKSECGETITHADMMHWGGGDIAGIIKDKAKELGREHDEQFQKRQESFYDAATRKHSRDEVPSGDSWTDGDGWKPGK